MLRRAVEQMGRRAPPQAKREAQHAGESMQCEAAGQPSGDGVPLMWDRCILTAGSQGQL